MPLEQRFYDEEGVLARRMEFSGFRQVGWRTFPMSMTIFPSEKDRQTQLVYESIEFDVDIDESTFSLRRLRKGR